MTSYSLLNEQFMTFDSYYQQLIEHFQQKGLWDVVSAATTNDLVFPRQKGVYVIRTNDHIPLIDSILYVGMSGKVSNDGEFNGSQTLAKRRYRWNPYRFLGEVFEFDPQYEQGESRDRPPRAGYRHQFDLESIVTDCFCSEDFSTPVPAFLEAEILQMYLINKQVLPPANNKF